MTDTPKPLSAAKLEEARVWAKQRHLTGNDTYMGQMFATIDSLQTERDAYKAQAVMLRAALENWSWHLPNCCYYASGEKDCDCKWLESRETLTATANLSGLSVIKKDDLAKLAAQQGPVIVENESAIRERVLFALQHFYPNYTRNFESSGLVGEYYGRGQLEGLAVGLWAALGELPEWMDDKTHRAYVEVWGIDRAQEALKPEGGE